MSPRDGAHNIHVPFFRPLPTFDVEHMKEIKRKKGVSCPLWMKALLITLCSVGFNYIII